MHSDDQDHKCIRTLEERIESMRSEMPAARARDSFTSLDTPPIKTIVHDVVDIGVEQVGAEFGAYFHGSAGGAHTMLLYAQAGAPREAFELFSSPEHAGLLSRIFESAATTRCDDVLLDSRWAAASSSGGWLSGGLSVRSYLAASVRSPRGEVLGALFFGHSQPNIFHERTELIIQSIAALVAVALDHTALVQAVVRGERRFKALIENCSDGIVVVGPDAKIAYVSPAVTAIEGYEAHEIVGMDPMEHMHPEDVPMLREVFEHVIANPGVQVASIVRRRHKNGHWLWLEGITSNMVNDPAVNGIVVNFRDVSERKRSEEALIRSQKMEALGTLAGGIAHDFNNLLLAIVGNAKLAMADLDGEHPAQESLAQIAKAGHRATDLVKRILAFSRKQDSQREVADLQTITEDAIRLLRATLPALVKIEVRGQTDVPPVEVDSAQFHQVIVALMTNAAYAIGDRAGSIEVEVCEVSIGDELTASADLQPGRYARLSVGDDGCGMSQDVLSRIFDPFFTTKPTGQATGLGLSVAHGIVKAHGGGIVAVSEPGKGSAFHVYLPLTTSRSDPSHHPVRAVVRGRGERVLYVDDDDAIVFLVTRILERLGYNVTGCESPGAALDTFRAAPDAFDVVVTDLSMPGMSGFDVAREVRRVRPDMPILMTSGYVRPEDEKIAHAVGIRDLILKPNTVEELGDSLDRLFRKLRL